MSKKHKRARHDAALAAANVVPLPTKQDTLHMLRAAISAIESGEVHADAAFVMLIKTGTEGDITAATFHNKLNSLEIAGLLLRTATEYST